MLALLLPTLILASEVTAQPMPALSPFVIPSPHKSFIHNIVISDDQKKMVTVGGLPRLGYAMILWDLEAKKEIHRFDGAAFPQFLPSNQAFVSLNFKLAAVLSGPHGWAGWEVNEHDVKTGTTKKLYLFEGDEHAVALWPDKKIVVADAQPRGAPESTYALHFFDYGTKKRHVLPVGHAFRVMCFSHDRKLVVIRIGKGGLRVFDWEAKKKISDISTLDDGVNEKCQYCIFLRDDSALLTGISGSFQLQVWDWKAAKLTKTVREPTNPYEKCPPALSPDGRLLATFGSQSVGFFDTKKFAYTGRAGRVPVEANSLHRICFTPDGRSLVIGDSNGNLRVLAVPKVND